MTAPADSMEAFEEAMGPDAWLERRMDGEYASIEINGAWRGWQAALTHQGRVVPVSVLEGQIGRMAVSKASAEGASGDYMDGYADACRHFISDLRAIIEKGEV